MSISFLKNNLTIILIVIAGFLLRVYSLSQNFYYTMDEEVMNLIQRRIVLGEHFPLIGSVSPLSTYLGPIFYYFGAAILFLSSLNPLGQGIFGIILGSINIFLIYFVGSKLFNKNVGLVSAILYSFSFLQILFDRRYWHLTPGTFLSLLVLYSLYKIKNGSIKYAYLLVGALIFGWNTDYTNLVLFLFVFFAWFLFKLPIRKKEVLLAILIFIISNAPLVLFDLRHEFLNTKAFLGYFTSRAGVELEGTTQRHYSDRESLGENNTAQAMQTAELPLITFSRLFYINSPLNISTQHTYCKDYIFARNSAQGFLPWAFLGVLIYFGYLVYKNRGEKNYFSYKIVLTFYLIFQLGILFYAFVFKGDVFEHYMSTLLPYFFLIAGVVLSSFLKSKKSYLIYLVILSFVFLNIYSNFYSYNPLGYQNKRDAAKYALSIVGDEDFSLDSIGDCFRYDGFYYPFILEGRHPVKSYQDPNYSWLYNYQVSEKHPENVVVLVSKGDYESDEFNETYQRYQQWVKNKKTFGGIEVLILDNSKGEFK